MSEEEFILQLVLLGAEKMKHFANSTKHKYLLGERTVVITNSGAITCRLDHEKVNRFDSLEHSLAFLLEVA